MAVNAFTSNQGTQTAILTDNTGGTAGTVIPVMKVSMDGQGTYTDANLFQGTIKQVNNIGTIPNVPGGTIGSIVGVGSVSGLSNLPGGTLNNIASGTINSATITGNVGISSGTINVSTISTLPNIPGGTIGSVVGVGSVSGLSNLPQGSIQVTAGTVSAGTINVGTVQLNPLTATNTISHAGTSGTLEIGTLVGTASIGVGTALYPTGYRIIVISGTAEVVLAFGSQTNGNQVVHHGLYPAGGGIANPIPYPHGYGTTNSPLTYQILSGAGTVSWDVDYFTHT